MSRSIWIPEDKAQLLSDMHLEWTALMQVIHGLTDEQMEKADESGWAPRDQLAHLCEWMKVLLGYHLGDLPRHEVLGVDASLAEDDYDGINAVLLERNRSRTVEEILGEMRKVYAEVVMRVNGMSFEALLRPRFPEDPRKRPVLNWVIANTTDHFAEHRNTINKGFEE